MRGLILTGPLGVGKTTVQAALRAKHGFWIPPTYTTREIGEDEADLVRVDAQAFLGDTRAGRIVMPLEFGGAWYGWSREDLCALRLDDGKAILNVRPYTALLLQAFLSDFVAVWLTVDQQELVRRRRSRGAARDTVRSVGHARSERDVEDQRYRDCFARICVDDDSVTEQLARLV